MSNESPKGPAPAKPWLIYVLGLIVVALCVGAAIAHTVFTNGASPLGPTPAPTSITK